MVKQLGAVILLAALIVLAGCSSKDCPTCDPATAVLQLDKHKIDFGDTDTIQTFNIMNKGKASLSWTISTLERNPGLAKRAGASHIGWLELSNESGTGNKTITVVAHRGDLDEIGASRLVLIISSNASNTATDSVDVHILAPHKWLSDDDGSFEECATVNATDYYWVKRFDMPAGASAVLVDSIRFIFCDAGEDIQLIAFDALTNQQGIVAPNNFLFTSPPPIYGSATGTNTFATHWYFNTSPFFIGYFQTGSSTPRIYYDNSPGENDTTGCYVASDVSTDPDSVTLQWFIAGISQVFAMQVFVTPVLDYNPKLVAGSNDNYAEEALRAGFALKGTSPRSYRPKF